MAKKTIIDAITKLYSKLGGNLSDVLGTRSNVNFMGTGKTSEGFLDMDLNVNALGSLSQSKAVNELKSAVGFATADKLNDLQANKLLTNMMRMDEFYNPTPNITDMATGTRNLDNEGLAALRGMTDETADVPFPEVENLPAGVGLRKALPDQEKSALMTRLDDIVKKKQTEAAAAKTTPFDEAVEYNARPEDVVQNLVDQKFGIGYFDNVGATPSQRGSAREFLVEALKKENPNQTNFSDIVDAVDVKYITEGGGGLAGDPLTLVNKYFGPRIAEMVPSGGSSEEIAIFTERVLNNVVDANGLRPGDPRFDRLTAKFTENFADGGIAGLETRQGLRFGGKAAKAILSKINKKMIQDAADDIFPTGDYKYDAEMVVESLVENNPKLFKNLLAEDLDDVLRSELYGLAVDETGSRAATAIKANRAIKPVKSAESMKKTGTIDISDPEIADEVTTYIKETDPQGYEKLKKGAFGGEVQSMDEFMGYPQGTIQPTRISDEGLKRIYMESLETGEFRGSFEDFKIYADQVLGLGRKPNAEGGLAGILEVGRQGYAEGGAIYPRLSTLSSGVESAEQQLQSINTALQEAESNLGSGSSEGDTAITGGPSFTESFEDPITGGGQPLMLSTGIPPGGGSQLGTPEERDQFRIKTIEERKQIAEDMNNAPTGLMKADGTRAPVTFENIADGSNTMPSMPIKPKSDNPFGNIMQATPSTGGGPSLTQTADPAREAYDKAVQAAKKQRAEGFMGRVVLPGERSFEDFSSGFNYMQNNPNSLNQLQGIGGGLMGSLGGFNVQKPVLSIGNTGQNRSPFARGGLAKILEV